MMWKRIVWMILCLLVLLIMTGCMDQAELTERGFVMGIAIDQSDEGKILLTTQFLKPSQSIGMSGKAEEQAFINITTSNDTLAKAIRDIPIKLGRKAQFSHTRLIIIGEQFATEQGISNILEFFYRDHEPRLTISVLIAEGQASQYLKKEPFIENTTSQQLFQSQKASADYNEKTMEINLLKLGLQMKSEVGNALIPYLYLSKEKSRTMNIAGVALLKKGKLVSVMKPKKVENLHMLINDYKSGMIDIPCKKQEDKDPIMESVEVVSFKSNYKPTSLNEKPLKVRVEIVIEIAIVELICTKIETAEEEQKFIKIVEKTIEKNVADTTDWLKKIKFDAIGLGNKVYMKDPSVWKEWKKNWDDRFAMTQFDIEVEARIINSGTTISKPFISE